MYENKYVFFKDIITPFEAFIIMTGAYYDQVGCD